MSRPDREAADATAAVKVNLSDEQRGGANSVLARIIAPVPDRPLLWSRAIERLEIGNCSDLARWVQVVSIVQAIRQAEPGWRPEATPEGSKCASNQPRNLAVPARLSRFRFVRML
jgi:hypothetical protein